MKKLTLLLLCQFIVLSWGLGQSKCDGDTFDGQIRKEAKTSIGTKTLETMTVKAFLSTFKGKPEDLDDSSPRSDIEQRNVSVTAWLYSYAREDDEDFHLILGSTNKSTGRKFMTAEISGLPKSSSKYYVRLKKARDQFKEVILKGEDYCSGFTKKYLKNPIKVIVTGSVFYDTHHASGGSGTGTYKAKSAWEIHPITSIELVN